MNILITGSSGFVGSHLQSVLSQKYDNVVGLTRKYTQENSVHYCELSRPKMTETTIEHYNPDIVIHCAANPKPKHPDDPIGMLEDNVTATLNLLESVKPGTKFIFLSSVLVYGDSFPLILPTNLYGATKVASEALVTAYSKLKDLEAVSIRMCAVVGPNTTHGLLYDLKRKINSDSEYLELFGDEPGTIKPYAHIDDLTNYISNLINGSEKFPNTINFGPKDNMSVKDVAECIMNKLGKVKPIKWLGEGTIWKGDNKVISTNYYKVERVPLKYNTSYEAIFNAV